ncbi:hypothetical protein AGLY_011305 [Aphis glycines]|uniref:Uncharacterized protein n=1 Tax=Aphis glycines TaxID=307491 RepID=A0A6G0TD22_APHGL|nr:hypothetical protein AGLY_011305 [Aphis glycines]
MTRDFIEFKAYQNDLRKSEEINLMKTIIEINECEIFTQRRAHEIAEKRWCKNNTYLKLKFLQNSSKNTKVHKLLVHLKFKFRRNYFREYRESNSSTSGVLDVENIKFHIRNLPYGRSTLTKSGLALKIEVVFQRFCVAKLWIKILSRRNYEKYFYELRTSFYNQTFTKTIFQMLVSLEAFKEEAAQDYIILNFNAKIVIALRLILKRNSLNPICNCKHLNSKKLQHSLSSGKNSCAQRPCEITSFYYITCDSRGQRRPLSDTTLLYEILVIGNVIGDGLNNNIIT